MTMAKKVFIVFIRIEPFTEVRFKQFFFMENTSQSGFTV